MPSTVEKQAARTAQVATASERITNTVKTNLRGKPGLIGNTIKVHPIGQLAYRVNVFVPDRTNRDMDVGSKRIAYSYFITVDLTGSILTSNPPLN